MNKVSIIVPVYNVEKYIKRCVDSILEQTYTNLEVILIDDGSKDSSGEICDSYESIDNRVKVIHKNNEGLGFARNTGLDATNGEFVTFIDGDDSISKDHIEKMVSALCQNGADTCLAGHTKVYKNSKVKHINVCAGKKYEGVNVKKQILSRMVGSNPNGSDYIEMSVCMVMFSRRIIDENQLRFHSERDFISEDLIFNFDYYPNSIKTVIIDDVGYYYYDNEGSLTTRYDPDRFTKQKIMTREVIKRTKDLGIYDRCEQRILNTFISIARYCVKLEQKFSRGKYKLFLKRVKLILDDETVKRAFNLFNNSEVSIKSKIVNILMKKKKYCLLWIIMKFKNHFGI